MQASIELRKKPNKKITLIFSLAVTAYCVTLGEIKAHVGCC
jgi:hypothetical protein